MRITSTRKSFVAMLALGILSGGATAPVHAQMTSGSTGGAGASSTAPVFDADSEWTPGAELVTEVEPQAVAPYAAPGDVFVPESSKAFPAHAGVRAHTNYVIHKPNGGIQPRVLLDLSQPEPAADPTPDATFAEYPVVILSVQNGANLCGMRSDE